MRDVHLRLTDEAFLRAEKEAEIGGTSVEQFLADYLRERLTEDQKWENLDSLFTPEVLAEIDEAIAEADSDPTRYTLEEVKQHFAEKSAAWKRSRAS
jgi:hypothetical protein